MYRLLITDDEIIEREAVKYIVCRDLPGIFEICEAANGRELVEKAVKFRPDIILTDIKMPGINGLEATAKIRESLPECRIIIMSAFMYFNYAKEALTLGADEYIIKPAPAEVIVATLNKAITCITENRMRKKREEDINIKLKSITQYLEEELIILMSSGEIEEKVIKEFFEILNIESKAFVCTAISFFDRSLPDEIGSEVQKRIIKKRIMEKLKDKLHARRFQFFQGTIGQNIYLLLLEIEEIDEFGSRVLWTKSLSEIKDELHDEMYIDLNIGIGNQCKSIEQISNSFLQAKIALKYDSSPGSIISYGDICLEKTNTEYPLSKEKRLVEYFLQGDEKNSLQFIDEIIDWMMINLQRTESIKQKIYELLLILTREAALNLNLLELNSDSESMRRNLFLLDTMRELRIYAKSYMESKILDIRNIKISSANSLLKILTEYIISNFDKDISLESAADVIRISPFYLSKLFKKETGMNFIDYLTEFRIRKAKEFLAVPTNNIKDVCYMVGYKDPNYFARVFKKMSGITPTEYKDKKI